MAQLMEIKDYAFANCALLKEVHFGGVYNIGAHAFEDDFSLQGIVIPQDVSRIGSGAFNNCSALTIYAETPEKPALWSEGWNGDRPVVFNAITNIITANNLLREMLTKLEAERKYLTKESAAQKYLPAEIAADTYLTKNLARAQYITSAEAEETYAKKSDVTAIYRYRGSVNTYSELPLVAAVGDVYNVATEYTAPNGTVYPAGTNYAWTGSAWDALAGDLAPIFDKISNLEDKAAKSIRVSAGLPDTTTGYVPLTLSLVAENGATLSSVTVDSIPIIYTHRIRIEAQAGYLEDSNNAGSRINSFSMTAIVQTNNIRPFGYDEVFQACDGLSGNPMIDALPWRGQFDYVDPATGVSTRYYIVAGKMSPKGSGGVRHWLSLICNSDYEVKWLKFRASPVNGESLFTIDDRISTLDPNGY